MARPTADLDLDLSLVGAPPQLSALVEKGSLEAKLEEIQRHCAGIDLSPRAAGIAMRWLSALPLQIQTLEENHADTKRKWEIRARDIKALVPYYRAVLKLYKEYKVSTPLYELIHCRFCISSVILWRGKWPVPVQRGNDKGASLPSHQVFPSITMIVICVTVFCLSSSLFRPR